MIAGSVSSVAVAWASAAFLDLGKHGTVYTNEGFGVPLDAGWQHSTRYTLAGPTFVRRVRVYRGLSPSLSSAPFRPLSTLFTQSSPKVSSKGPPDSTLSGEWGTLRTKPVAARIDRVWLEDARGWPALCVYCERLENPGDEKESSFLELPVEGAPDELTVRMLPLFPIWRGLLVNTAFFGVVWAIPLVIVPLMRRALRRRRGLCAKCGYDLAGNALGRCPECGMARA